MQGTMLFFRTGARTHDHAVCRNGSEQLPERNFRRTVAGIAVVPEFKNHPFIEFSQTFRMSQSNVVPQNRRYAFGQRVVGNKTHIAEKQLCQSVFFGVRRTARTVSQLFTFVSAQMNVAQTRMQTNYIVNQLTRQSPRFFRKRTQLLRNPGIFRTSRIFRMNQNMVDMPQRSFAMD